MYLRRSKTPFSRQLGIRSATERTLPEREINHNYRHPVLSAALDNWLAGSFNITHLLVFISVAHADDNQDV
jgi:hypothetical protein